MTPYTATNASRENKGLPVWEVRGPGYSRLVYRHAANAINVELVRLEAERLAADLNEAYEAGRLAELRAKSRGGAA